MTWADRPILYDIDAWYMKVKRSAFSRVGILHRVPSFSMLASKHGRHEARHERKAIDLQRESRKLIDLAKIEWKTNGSFARSFDFSP